MKYYPKLGLYKASNVTFDPSTCRAYSYIWWRFVDRINGYVVFNNYRYSNTTSKHQWKVRAALREEGIDIDEQIEAPDGLQRGLDGSIKYYERKIDSIYKVINSPRSQKLKNEERYAEIYGYRQKIKFIKERLMK